LDLPFGMHGGFQPVRRNSGLRISINEGVQCRAALFVS
jgi:hypothetical protein